jgi:hypothetical protein
MKNNEEKLKDEKKGKNKIQVNIVYKLIGFRFLFIDFIHIFWVLDIQ